MAADPSTSEAATRAAWQAILAGDYAERDRLCERARALLLAEEQAARIEQVLAVDFYIKGNGVVIPTQKMARAAGVLQ